MQNCLNNFEDCAKSLCASPPCGKISVKTQLCDIRWILVTNIDLCGVGIGMLTVKNFLLMSGILAMAISVSGCDETVASSQTNDGGRTDVQQECVTSNDAEFARLVADLQNQITGYDQANFATFSKCGWVEFTRSSGTTYRVNFADLTGDINFVYGAPVYLKAWKYSYRSAGQRNFRLEPSSTTVAYISTTNLAASQRAVDRLNATLTRLARVATGETVNVFSGAEQASNVARTQSQLRTVGATIGQIAANAPRQCNASTQCYASCEGLSRDDYASILSLSSSYTRCQSRCSEISC